MVEFHVLRCADCQTFQVMQVTKSVKWKCKMCGQKQSVTKVYGQGTGADCRRHVQKLNGLRCQTKWTNEEQLLVSASCGSSSMCIPCPENTFLGQETSSTTTQISRWSSFVDEAKDEEGGSWQTDYENRADSRTTTDWHEYQENMKRGKRKRHETAGSPAMNSQKLKKSFHESPSLPISFYDTQRGRKLAHESCGQNSRNGSPISSTANKVYHCHSTISEATIVKNKPVLFSLSTETTNQEEGDFPCLLSAGLKEDDSCSLDVKNKHFLAENATSHKLLSQNVLSENKGRSNQKKVNSKQEFVSRMVGGSKWGMFLENVDNEDDNSDDTLSDSDGVFTTIAKSKVFHDTQPDLL